MDLTENIYSVTLKDLFSPKAYPTVRFDSSFTLLLNEFINDYSQLLDIQDNAKPTTIYSLGPVNSLTITGGLNTISISCDNPSDLSGFNNLFNRINLALAN